MRLEEKLLQDFSRSTTEEKLEVVVKYLYKENDQHMDLLMDKIILENKKALEVLAN